MKGANHTRMAHSTISLIFHSGLRHAIAASETRSRSVDQSTREKQQPTVSEHDDMAVLGDFPCHRLFGGKKPIMGPLIIEAL